MGLVEPMHVNVPRMAVDPTLARGAREMQSSIHDSKTPQSGVDGDAASEDLVQMAQGGSQAAFEELQKTYSQRLFKQIVAITRHHQDAEDALQEALCKAYMALPRFERRCHVYTWMSRIAINCALMKVRRRKTLRECSMDDQDPAGGQEPIKELADQNWSPEEICMADERLRHLHRISRSLDPISKQALMLRINNEYSLEEIADALKVSVPAAKARLYRARHRLKLFLPEQGGRVLSKRH
jgi:RNA polymerase sigma-70 factor (ECF subfamily)